MKFSFIIAFLISLPAWAKWSVSTYNIRNFDNDFQAGRTNLVELGKIIQDVKSDVMVFEEVGNIKAFNSLVQKELPGFSSVISNCGGTGRQHLSVTYDTKTFEYVEKVEDMTFSSNGKNCGSLRPVLLVSLKNKKTKTVYTFGAVHLKAGSGSKAFQKRWEQYGLLKKLAKQYASKNLILLGDFNSTGYILKDQDFERFEDFLEDSNLRTMTETLSCTNYWAGTFGGPEFQPSILDHIVVQSKNHGEVTDTRVGSFCHTESCRPATPDTLGVAYKSVSDHCPVQVSFR